MNTLPASPDAPSIVIRTVLSGGEQIPLERWVGALVDAISGAASSGAVGRWRIAIDDLAAAPALTAQDVVRLASHAETLDGFLDYRHSGAGAEAGSQGDEAEESLILDLAADVTILPSTIVRLVAALREHGGPVSPRMLPLDSPRWTASPTCVLSERLPTAGVSSRAAGGSSPTECVEAIALTHSRFDLHGEPASAESASGAPALEELVEFVGGTESLSLTRARLGGTPEPRVSVVVRTQLRRPEALREALLCLAGQVDDRFEVLLIVHDGDADEVQLVVADQPSWLRSRTTVIEASGGTRARPINVGISAATGSHVVFFDDDDLVLPTWVGAFITAAIEHPRQVLRAVVGVQRVSAIEWPSGLAGHISDPEIESPYPRVFDLADHLRVNMTPFMALAFPLGVLDLIGGADEDLDVCEDWDLLLRASRVVGVVDIPEFTAVYRRWTTGADSYTVHDNAVWERDMNRVMAKLDAAPLLLPAGSASMLARLSTLRAASSELAAVYQSTSWKATAPLRWLSGLSRRAGARSRQAGR